MQINLTKEAPRAENKYKRLRKRCVSNKWRINDAIAVRKGRNTCAKPPGFRYSLSKGECEMFGFVLKVQEFGSPKETKNLIPLFWNI